MQSQKDRLLLKRQQPEENIYNTIVKQSQYIKNTSKQQKDQCLDRKAIKGYEYTVHLRKIAIDNKNLTKKPPSFVSET